MAFVKGYTPWNKGKKLASLTEEHKRKLSLAHKGKISPMKGRRHTLIARKKMRLSHKGHIPWNAGKKTGTLTKEHRMKLSIAKKGSKHPNWKGGRRIRADGYILTYHPNHPYATEDNYILEHRFVMEHHIKRYLKPKEVIHHINENRADNRIENLMLFANNGNHLAYHKRRHRLTALVNCNS